MFSRGTRFDHENIIILNICNTTLPMRLLICVTYHYTHALVNLLRTTLRVSVIPYLDLWLRKLQMSKENKTATVAVIFHSVAAVTTKANRRGDPSPI